MTSPDAFRPNAAIVSHPEEFPVVQILPPMPVRLAAAIYAAVSKACQNEGYEAFHKVADGIGVVWVRRLPDEQEPDDA